MTAPATSSKDVWLSPGVLPEEEPFIEARNGPAYKGVRMPFSYATYLLRGNELAEAGKSRLNVAVSGLGRIVKEYGVPVTRDLLAGKGGSEEQLAYVKRIIALERIRCAVTHAVTDVLGLGAVKEVIGVTEEMTTNPEMRDDIFDPLEQLLAELETNIPYFSRKVALSNAFEDGLPDSKKGDSGEIRYPATEVVVASHLTNRTPKGIYKVPKGAGCIAVGSKPHTKNECLRVAGIEAVGLIDRVRGHSLAGAWSVDGDLDGLAFFHDSGKSALPCDPYYLRYEDTTGGESSSRKPLKVPMLPWSPGWVTKNMTGDDGIGVAPGQAQDVVRRSLSPVLRRHLKRVLADPAGGAQLRGSWGHRFEQMAEWVATPNHRLLTPYQTMPEFNDAVRGICEAITTKAMEYAKEDAANEPQK